MWDSVDAEGLERRTARTSSRFVTDASGVVGVAGSCEAWEVFEMVMKGSLSWGVDVVRRGVRRPSMVGGGFVKYKTVKYKMIVTHSTVIPRRAPVPAALNPTSVPNEELHAFNSSTNEAECKQKQLEWLEFQGLSADMSFLHRKS